MFKYIFMKREIGELAMQQQGRQAWRVCAYILSPQGEIQKSANCRESFYFLTVLQHSFNTVKVYFYKITKMMRVNTQLYDLYSKRILLMCENSQKLISSSPTKKCVQFY